MTTHNRPFPREDVTPTEKVSPRTHVLIWVLVTLAALLLVGFTAVVDDITERGEMRRVQQRASGAFALPDDLQPGGVDVFRLLSMAGGKLAQR
jgi:hypothetical protein